MADIPYMWVQLGLVNLAAVIDLFTRFNRGLEEVRSLELTLGALRRALAHGSSRLLCLGQLRHTQGGR